MTGWYDIKSLDTINHIEDVTGILQSVEHIQRLIQEEIEKTQLDPSNILLGGFSQGGAIALATALHGKGSNTEKLAGVVACSSYLPIRKELLNEEVKSNCNLLNMPILMLHGDADQLIPLSIGQMSYQTLISNQFVNCQFKSYPNMGHSLCVQEIGDICAFVKKSLKL